MVCEMGLVVKSKIFTLNKEKMSCDLSVPTQRMINKFQVIKRQMNTHSKLSKANG